MDDEQAAPGAGGATPLEAAPQPDRVEERARAQARQALLAEHERRPWISRTLHRLDAASASAGAAPLAAAVSATFLLAALLAPRASPWLTAFQALAAAITLIMVFVLQHTQSRQQAALQRKLDEILRVLPGADPRAVHLETASERELAALDERHHWVRGDALQE